ERAYAVHSAQYVYMIMILFIHKIDLFFYKIEDIMNLYAGLTDLWYNMKDSKDIHLGQNSKRKATCCNFNNLMIGITHICVCIKWDLIATSTFPGANPSQKSFVISLAHVTKLASLSIKTNKNSSRYAIKGMPKTNYFPFNIQFSATRLIKTFPIHVSESEYIFPTILLLFVLVYKIINKIMFYRFLLFLRYFLLHYFFSIS
ncbi:hypothetical protein ACJX0J_040877, partial [Zea mays]